MYEVRFQHTCSPPRGWGEPGDVLTCQMCKAQWKYIKPPGMYPGWQVVKHGIFNPQVNLDFGTWEYGTPLSEPTKERASYFSKWWKGLVDGRDTDNP